MLLACDYILAVQDHHDPSTATTTPLPQQQMRISPATETERCFAVCRSLSVYSPATYPAGDDVIIHFADKLPVATQLRNNVH